MNYQLTPDEQEIENEADQMQPVTGEKRARIEGILERARRGRAISLRIAEADLELVKKRAEDEGIPYQTLINSIVHKYVTYQLYEKDEVRKVLSELKESYKS